MLLIKAHLWIVCLGDGEWIGLVSEIGTERCCGGEREETSEEKHPDDHEFFLVPQENDKADKQSDGESKQEDVEIGEGVRSIQIFHDPQGKRGISIGEHTEAGKHGAIGKSDDPTCPVFDCCGLEKIPVLGIRGGDGFPEEILCCIRPRFTDEAVPYNDVLQAQGSRKGGRLQGTGGHEIKSRDLSHHWMGVETVRFEDREVPGSQLIGRISLKSDPELF